MTTDASGNKRAQTVAAISQIRQRGAVLPPTIDFTVHVGDDGQMFNTTERVVKEVQAPAFFKPTDEQFYSDATKSKPDIAFLKNHFYREGRLTDEQVSTAALFPPATPAKGSVSLCDPSRTASSPHTLHLLHSCCTSLGHLHPPRRLQAPPRRAQPPRSRCSHHG